jgi:1,4-alpha-glucan branching enzyme
MPDKSFNALIEAREHDPFRILGLHQKGGEWRLAVFRPHADAVAVETAAGWQPLARQGDTDVFLWRGATPPPRPWRLRVQEAGGERFCHDPYAFPPRPSEHDLYLFAQGGNYQAYHLLGARPESREGIAGVCFRVWAPNAGRVSVVGDFNRWDGRVHPMCSLGGSGSWELFLPGLPAGSLY